MATNETRPTPVDPADFIAAVEHPTRRADAETLLAMMTRVTGFPPRMWGPSIVGFGRYHYRYESGREGDWMLTGFSPRKSSLTLYIMSGFSIFGELLKRLGKHEIGKSCLYINRLEDVDRKVLRRLVKESVAHVKRRYRSV